MSIYLESFENLMSRQIVQRGRDYFLRKRVQKIKWLNKHELEAFVSGSSKYKVELSIRNGYVTEVSCNCPYDHGLICKHMTAVFFALRAQDEFEKTYAEEIKEESTVKARTSKEKAEMRSSKEQLAFILPKLPREKIADWLTMIAEHDPDIAQQIIVSGTHLLEVEKYEVEHYKQLVRFIFQTGKKQQLGHAKQQIINSRLERVGVNLAQFYEQEDWLAAWVLTKGTLEGIIDQWNLGHNLLGREAYQRCTDELSKLSQQSIDEKLRSEMWKWARFGLQNPHFDIWRLDSHFIKIIAKLTHTAQERQNISELVKLKKYQAYIITLTKSFPPQERWKLLWERREDKEVRMLLLNLAQLDTERREEYLQLRMEEMLLNPSNARFKAFKGICTDEEWLWVRELLIEQFAEQDADVLMDFYEEEKMFKELLTFIQENIDHLEWWHYTKVLYSLYPEQIINMTEYAVRQKVKMARNRTDYRKIADVIEALEKEEKKAAKRIVHSLLTDYSRRSALRDELLRFI